MTDLQTPPLQGAAAAALHQPPAGTAWSFPASAEFVPVRVHAPTEERRRFWRRGPSAQDIRQRNEATLIRDAAWQTSRRVVVAPPKSSFKTPSSVILAGMIGEQRGGDVIAWDASEGAGTLHARSGGAQFHCVGDVALNPEKYTTRAAVSRAVAVQTSGAHIMGSLVERELRPVDVQSVFDVLNPHYSIQIADTGANATHSPTFRETLDRAHAVVVPTTLQADSVNKSAEFIYRLHGSHPELARHAVVILSHYGQQVTPGQARATLLRAGAPEPLDVPFDPHIAEGGEIITARLSKPSRYAWTTVAANLVTVLEGTPA
jgi:MinD-like ATPase involved in chromosome partitioning or flagellar assembly